jgi:hypothetical protein
MTLPKRLSLIFAALVAAALLLFAGWVWLTLHWSYSDGERAGYLQKFSSKGWVCKTWEGELLLSSMPGAIPERFAFSVRDEALARQISAAAGKRVVISYAQYRNVPTNCFGETEYYAKGVVVSQ